MTDPLTPDYRAAVERIREVFSDNRKWHLGTGDLINTVDALIDVIDSLTERKQYTESELRSEFEEYPVHVSFKRNDNFYQWIHCAHHFGLLKPTPSVSESGKEQGQ